MDDQTRITRLEVEMEHLRESNARLQRSVDALHGEMVDLREYIDQRLLAQQASNDENFREIRAAMERGFAESRADAAQCRAEAAQDRAETKATKRWVIGLLASTLVGLAGIAAKLFF